jgi:outer membrane protein assembly factor BamD
MQAFSYHRDQDWPQFPRRRTTLHRLLSSDTTLITLLALSYYDQIDEVGRDQGLTSKLQAPRRRRNAYPDTRICALIGVEI